MTYRHIRTVPRGKVLELVLARPDNRNALGVGPGSSRDEISRALAEAASDPSVSVVLLRGDGKSFCAGGDLSGLTLEGPEDDVGLIAAVDAFHLAVRSFPKPIVAAVQGHCLGAGLSMVAYVDIIVAGDSARFGLPEAKFGHPAGTELVPLVGSAWTKYLALTGELIDAATAVRIGLAVAAVPDADLESRAMSLADRIATIPVPALCNHKRAIGVTVEAGGREAGRIAGRLADVRTLVTSHSVRADSGRTFDEIREEEGLRGLLAALPRPSTTWLEEVSEGRAE